MDYKKLWLGFIQKLKNSGWKCKQQILEEMQELELKMAREDPDG